MATANDLLLHLRCHAPYLARRLDPIRGLGVVRGAVTVRAAEGGWCAGELLRLRPELEREAEQIFGEPMRLELELRPSATDALPLPVVSTKFWNHVAFIAATPQAVGAVVVPKPLYQEQWVPLATAGGYPCPGDAREEDRVEVLRYPASGADSAEELLLSVLPDLLDDLSELARACRSYAQLVMAFPGDRMADRVEARLYGIKEWGTPRTPGPVLHKYVGRIHYLPPDAPHLGLCLAAEV